jgi:hypothetical protein
LPVTAAMLSGPLNFLEPPRPPVSGFAEPIPYGIANNTVDNGWIWSQDGALQVDFGQPQVVSMFRAFCTYPNEARGAQWTIEHSDDAASWAPVADMYYQSQSGAGLTDAGCREAGFAGWYSVAFNPDRVAARYWRVREAAIILNHAPRTAEIQFFDVPPATPSLRLEYAWANGSLTLSWTDPTDTAVLQWADGVTGDWHDLPTATSPYPVDTSETARFYRLRQ